MSFSLQSPNLYRCNNAAFDAAAAAADSARAKTWLPLQPISINLSGLPKLHPSKPLAPAKPSKNPHEQDSGAIAAGGDIEAEIEEIEKKIWRLSARLEALRIKKTERDLRTTTTKPFVTKDTVTGWKKKVENFAVDSSVSGFQRRGLSIGQSKKRGKSENRIGTVSAKKLEKTEDVNYGSLKPKTLFHQRQNTATGKKPVQSDKVRVVASRYSLRIREPESKRHKWSLPEPAKEKSGRIESKRFLSLEK